MADSVNNHGAFVWSIAEVLRGVYTQSDYQKVILPLVVLRRLGAVLEPTKDAVLDKFAEHSESSMNGFPENQTARRFDTDEYRIMVVAEKFQTGFGQPLLHTMYVDKTLSGLAAEQTLSRLNRRHDDKEDTFVLDFRNDTDDIAKAFEPYYGKTMAIPTDPNEMGDARHALAALGVIWDAEIGPVVTALKSDASKDQAKVYAGLEPALGRFGGMSEDQQVEFRDALKRYINIYSFMSQVVPYTDQQMEDWYVYARALRSVLPHRSGEGAIEVSSKIELTHLRVELGDDDADISLDEADILEIIFGGGTHTEAEKETLAEIIRQINAQLDRLTKNEDLVMKILDSTEIKNALEAFYVERIYNALREPG